MLVENRYLNSAMNLEQWNLTGGDHPYHCRGSAIWFTRIGHAMAEVMGELHQAQ